jgi:hypothetical protein
MRLFDSLDDYRAEHEPKPEPRFRLHSETTRHAEADALRRAFGTRTPAPLSPAQQDDLFNPHPQERLRF